MHGLINRHIRANLYFLCSECKVIHFANQQTVLKSILKTTILINSNSEYTTFVSRCFLNRNQGKIFYCCESLFCQRK